MLLVAGTVCTANAMTINEANAKFRSRPLYLTVEGKTWRVWKEFDPKTNTAGFVSDDAKFRGSSHLDELELAAARERVVHCGAMSPDLAGLIATLKDGDSVDVWVGLKCHPEEFPDKSQMTREQLGRYVSEKAACPDIPLPVVDPREFVKRRGVAVRDMAGVVTCVDPAQSVLRCRLTPREIRAAANDPDVCSVERFCEPRQLANGPSHYTLVTSAMNPSMSYLGTPAVHCATIEGGVGTPFLSCIGVGRTTAIDDCLTKPCQPHAQSVFALMHWTSPQSTPMHDSLGWPRLRPVKLFIQANSVNTASASYENGGAAESDDQQAIDCWAFKAPYTTWATPTSNYEAPNCGANPVCLEPSWQAYNAICVGNVRHLNLAQYVMAGCTQTRNPLPPYEYQHPDTLGGSVRDRELPSVVVPGYQPTGHIDTPSTFMDDACLDSSNCGTSWCAPILNGICANLMSANTWFMYWPEAIRATVLVTARDVDGQWWDQWVDGKDGAGTVCGYDAEWFIRNRSGSYPGAGAVEHGMYTSSWLQTDNTTKTFNIRIPAAKPSGRHLRIVLTWDANPDTLVAPRRTKLTDLGLYMWVGSNWYFCDSYWSNTEVIEVPCSLLTAGSSYQFMVTHTRNRLTGTPQKMTYWSVAWTWVKDNAN